MGEQSNIAWTDATVNFWWGCTKVGPGCDHCYAQTLSDRFEPGHWGAGAPRKKIKGAVKLLHWLDNDYSEWAADAECRRGNAKAFGLPVPAIGNRRRVFIQSMSDFFDNEVPEEWRTEAWDVMTRCDRISIQLLTKRIGNVEKMVSGPWPKHIGLMITVVNQDEADRDIPKLRDLAAERAIPWIGISYEPALGPLDLSYYLQKNTLLGLPALNWVICGGESGPGARPIHPDWARLIRNQCDAAGVPFFFKQWGEFLPVGQHLPGHGKVHGATAVKPSRMKLHYGGSLNQLPQHAFAENGVEIATTPDSNDLTFRVGKARAGRLLDGRTHDEFPEVK